jgi:hypothetical protein
MSVRLFVRFVKHNRPGRGITFDMSGDPEAAQQALGRSLLSFALNPRVDTSVAGDRGDTTAQAARYGIRVSLVMR